MRKVRYDFLQIHDSRPMTSWEERCVKQLKSLVTGRDTYTMLDLPYYPTFAETVNQSDKLRGEWLGKHPNGFYVDTDCFLSQRYVPTVKNTVHLPINANVSDGLSPDIFMIIVNGNTEWILNNFSATARYRWIMKNVQEEFRAQFYGYPLQLTRSWTGFQFIPQGIYTHRYQTMSQEYITRNRRGTASMAPEANGQSARHINDITNEQLAAFDKAVTGMKVFVDQLRELFNAQCDRTAQLEGEIEELKKGH